MIRIQVASANSSIAKTRNRPASGAGTGSAGLGPGGPGRPGQVGRQPVDLALRLGDEGGVDSLGQLVEGQPPRDEVLAQLGHGDVTLGVADPQVVVVPRPAGHVPSRYKLFTRLPRVGILVYHSGSDVISPCHRLPEFARLAASPFHDKSSRPGAEPGRSDNHQRRRPRGPLGPRGPGPPRRLPIPISRLTSARAARNSTIASGLPPPPKPPNMMTLPRMTNSHTMPMIGAKAPGPRGRWPSPAAVAVVLSRPGGHRTLPRRPLPCRAPVRRARGRPRGLREVAHHGVQVGLGLGRERLVEALVQFLERQSPVREVLTQLGGDCVTIGVPDAHVVSRSHRALRSKERGIPKYLARYIARHRTASELPRTARIRDAGTPSG